MTTGTTDSITLSGGYGNRVRYYRNKQKRQKHYGNVYQLESVGRFCLGLMNQILVEECDALKEYIRGEIEKFGGKRDVVFLVLEHELSRIDSNCL